ncbi:NACHT nucleoside triphosphatase [Penicillium macrosclerotiorum]|uniref:NACHT nucleoside triphosphatase n=1 Tax=Penicillium macrosclerotiorum TaxID=303699 RepID=UPI0025491703|nr:NACHT nucleoside triphosphatase [Penicillium macrosclerotiorum]KAJ5688673.1 NACHT nucleoside triphosphatase [Penicillium macrosclerotiorum]
MADPLSIASGVAGFLSLGIQVTQTLIDFYSTYKGQNADLAKITRNIESLRAIFQSLEAAIELRQSQGVADDLLQEVEKAAQNCQRIVKELQDECQKLHADFTSKAGLKGRVQIAGRRALYPFRRSTIQKIEEDIVEIRENLSFALSVLQFKTHNRAEQEIATFKSLLERTKDHQISATICSWLMAPDPSVNHNALYQRHHQDTGLWLINSTRFDNWINEENSFLWISGFAGCGKSVICSTVIEHTSRLIKYREKAAIAYFYFSFNEVSKQDSHGMLCSLILQLSMQTQDGPKELEQLYETSKLLTPSMESLLQTFDKLLAHFQDTYIVLDALDESPQVCNREGVLGVIQDIRNLPSIHLLVTSRDHLDIRKSLNPSQASCILMRNSDNDKDISSFLSYQLNNDAKLQRWKERHNEIQEKLISSAQGVFRYVECQLRYLRKAGNRIQLDKYLNSMPRDLEETYERILCDIDEMHMDDVRRILTILCLTTRPLSIDELSEAHAVELNHEQPYLDREGRSYEHDDLVGICLGLVETVETVETTIPSTRNKCVSIVRIAHFSIQEYLQSERIQQQKARTFAIRKETSSADMASICLVHLLEPALSNALSDREMRESFPLAHFAAENWHHYWKNSQAGPKTEKLLLRLFIEETDSFQTVIWLYNFDEKFGFLNYLPWRQTKAIHLEIYYAALLGLGTIFEKVLEAHTATRSPSDLLNTESNFVFGNALQAASFQGNIDIVHLLLSWGADVNVCGGRFGTALQAASDQGHLEIVQLLLSQGANVNICSGRLGTALQAASLRDNIEIVQLLLSRGADVNVCGRFGTALQAASPMAIWR